MNADIRAVQRSERHIAHRLKSIAWDARRCEAKLAIVEDILASVDDALVDQRLYCFANLRCGAWYLPPHSYFRRRRALLATDGAEEASPHAHNNVQYADEQTTQCYFKSSDGHYGQWAFSVTRLNLGCLRMALIDSEGRALLHECGPPHAQVPHGAAGQAGGSVVVIVDATQHGKAYPDALSKTVPIWACVMSLVYGEGLHEDKSPTAEREASSIYEATAMRLLPPWVHRNEVLSIAKLLPKFVATAKTVLPLSPCTHRLSLPLHIEWAHAEDADAVWVATARHVAEMSKQAHVLLLVCCSGDAAWGHGAAASPPRELPSQGRGGWSYVRGAADDHQSWGMGLDAALFWANAATLTDPLCSCDDIEATVARIVKAAATTEQECRSSNPPLVGSAAILSASTPVGVVRTMFGGMVELRVAVGLAVGSLANEAVAEGYVLLCVEEGRSRDTQPTVLAQGIGALTVAVDSQSTKVGVERALVVCMRWLMDAVASRPPVADKTVVCIACQRPADAHLAASIALAARVLLSTWTNEGSMPQDGTPLPLPQRVSKQIIRQHQAVIADALSPAAMVRSDMVQVNRFFLSRHDTQPTNEN